MQPHKDEPAQAQNIPKMNEDSYRSGYSLQKSKPDSLEYTTSCKWEEHPPLPDTDARAVKRLSYAERRLLNYV